MIRSSARVVLGFAVLAGAGCAAVDDPAPDPGGPAHPGAQDPGGDSTPPIGTPTDPPATAIASGTWTQLANVPIDEAGFMLLLTDGSVLVAGVQDPQWWRLKPNLNGSYLNGTWSQIAPLPTGYAPLYFGAGVLPDGRVMIEGGEYNGNSSRAVWTTKGAIYDPVANSWRVVQPPAGWTSIGDASAVVLANGTYMQSDCCTTQSALLDPATLTWTPTGAGKQGSRHDEESWTALPDGTILTVDCNNVVNLLASELYTPSTGRWTLGPNTANKTCDINPDGSGSHENGPAVLRYDGKVFAIGGTGHNDIYDFQAKTWTAAPDSPVIAGEGQLDSADGPAVLLPNGNLLMALSPGIFKKPTHMLEWNGQELGEVARPPAAVDNSSFHQNFMLLPTGEVLLTDFSNDIEMYKPANPTPVAIAQPVITSTPALLSATGAIAAEVTADAVPVTTLHPGRSYRVSARRMNGLSEAVAYGDDASPATNYPILRITNNATHHVFYCRSFNHSNRAIGVSTTGSTSFAVPAGTELGASTLELVANGIPSPPVAVNIK